MNYYNDFFKTLSKENKEYINHIEKYVKKNVFKHFNQASKIDKKKIVNQMILDLGLKKNQLNIYSEPQTCIKKTDDFFNIEIYTLSHQLGVKIYHQSDNKIFCSQRDYVFSDKIYEDSYRYNVEITHNLPKGYFSNIHIEILEQSLKNNEKYNTFCGYDGRIEDFESTLFKADLIKDILSCPYQTVINDDFFEVYQLINDFKVTKDVLFTDFLTVINTIKEKLSQPPRNKKRITNEP